MNPTLKEYDKIYYNGDIYEAIYSLHCSMCCFFDQACRRCTRGICTRYHNTMEKPIVFRHFAAFHPQYIDQIVWSSPEQKIYVYEEYKQQIYDYHRQLADEISRGS